MSRYLCLGSLYTTEGKKKCFFLPSKQEVYYHKSLETPYRCRLNWWGRVGGKRLQKGTRKDTLLLVPHLPGQSKQGKATAPTPALAVGHATLLAGAAETLTHFLLDHIQLLPGGDTSKVAEAEGVLVQGDSWLTAHPSSLGSASTPGTGISSHTKPMGLGSSKGLPAGLRACRGSATSHLRNNFFFKSSFAPSMQKKKQEREK